MKKSLNTQPEIAKWIQEMIDEHHLPLVMKSEKDKENMVNVTINYQTEDYSVVAWVIDKSVCKYASMFS